MRRLLLILAALLVWEGLSAQYDINQFLMRGRRMLVDGKFAAAIDNFNNLIRVDDGIYDAYFFRGIAKYNLGDFMGAEADFDKALQLNPIYTPAYHYRAITLSRTGKYEEALKDLQEALDLRPSYTGLYFSRGVAYFLSQQFSKAIADFNKFIKNEQREGDAYLNRGACYLFVGDTTKALEDYNTAINLNMFDPEGYIRRSRVYAAQKRRDEAMADLNNAIRLDTTNAFAFFNRALLKYDGADIQGSLKDLNKVLDYEPGNALTLYNRAIIRSQIGDYNNALDDYDRVIAVNPNNVLAYFNRAGLFMQLGRYDDAIEDYTKSIELYPDFAKAYMNRSVAKNRLGDYLSASEDYKIAQRKVAEYQAKTKDSLSSSIFADTTKKYSSLLALDADFAKKDFNDELLQHRDVDIRLKPLYKFTFTPVKSEIMAFDKRYESKRLDEFIASVPIPVSISNSKVVSSDGKVDSAAMELTLERQGNSKKSRGLQFFAKSVMDSWNNRFNSALVYIERAIEESPKEAYFYLNRGVIQSEMIEFTASVGNNVQMLSLDNAGATRARVQDKSYKNYDYSKAISDMKRAIELLPDFPYAHYNLGNLYCLSGDLPESINRYNKAVELFPLFADAYYNRGLVLIYLKDKEKGCIDLSKAGELGVAEAYGVIKKYCLKRED